jgi:hypothetical protein
MAGFTSAAGGTDNGTTAGEQTGGFRDATWSGVAADGTDPGSTPIAAGVAAVSVRRLEPWGVELAPQVAVTSDSFASVNQHASGLFATPAWAPFNTNATEMQVVVPAGSGSTPVPAQTRGLGVLFLNVQTANTTEIQYYNGDILLGQVFAPAGTTSFAGLLFPDPVVTRAVITLGSAEIFAFNGSTASPGGMNPSTLVAGRDIVLAEPAPARPAVAATAGVPVTSVLDTFTESNPNATPRATIDWGDGTTTPGSIQPAAGGTFVVTGDHAYAETGSYTTQVTVDDSSGPEQTSQTQTDVGPRATTTSITCSPSPAAVTAATACIVTVADAGPGTPITPTGAVALTSPTAGVTFAQDSGCVLGSVGISGVAGCQILFTPTQLPPAQARIDAFYSGDDAHAASSGSDIVGVRAQRCTLKALSSKLKGHPAVLGMLVTCDARSNVTITGKAVGARKGRFKAFTLSFGTVQATVAAGRPTVVVIKPSSQVVAAVRTAGHRHQRVSLKLTLTASSHASRTTTTTRVAAFRIP